MAETCETCGRDLSQPVVSQRDREIESSLFVRVQSLASDPLRRRIAFCISVALVMAWTAWDTRPRHRGVALVSGPPPSAHAPARTGPKPFGPPWPPTEADWLREFAESSWTYPLPGPERQPASSCSRLFDPRADCTASRCAADFATQIWGEHVFAVHDGVVDRVVHATDERGGTYVRIAHWSGMVYTQYFHLAAVARGVVSGAHVKAGDTIGLVGDTGGKDSRVELHFTLSVRPSYEYPEVYMDPLPLLAKWPIQNEQGGVVGLISSAMPLAEHAHLLQPMARRHPHPARKKAPATPAAAEPAESTDSPD